MVHILYIAAGGGAGAVARYIFSKNINMLFGPLFPYGTLFVNVTGSFLIGLIFFLSENILVPVNVRSFMLIGFLGAYTTFSTFSLETVNLMKNGEYKPALVNLLLNNSVCIISVIAGMVMARAILKLLR